MGVLLYAPTSSTTHTRHIIAPFLGWAYSIRPYMPFRRIFPKAVANPAATPSSLGWAYSIRPYIIMSSWEWAYCYTPLHYRPPIHAISSHRFWVGRIATRPYIIDHPYTPYHRTVLGVGVFDTPLHAFQANLPRCVLGKRFPTRYVILCPYIPPRREVIVDVWGG
ncbi:MAG: hypothetical protein ACI4AH_04260 [Muribaculaceae bacterium]